MSEFGRWLAGELLGPVVDGGRQIYRERVEGAVQGARNDRQADQLRQQYYNTVDGQGSPVEQLEFIFANPTFRGYQVYDPTKEEAVRQALQDAVRGGVNVNDRPLEALGGMTLREYAQQQAREGNPDYLQFVRQADEAVPPLTTSPSPVDVVLGADVPTPEPEVQLDDTGSSVGGGVEEQVDVAPPPPEPLQRGPQPQDQSWGIGGDYFGGGSYPDIEQLQRDLAELGYDVQATGRIDGRTLDAMREFANDVQAAGIETSPAFDRRALTPEVVAQVTQQAGIAAQARDQQTRGAYQGDGQNIEGLDLTQLSGVDNTGVNVTLDDRGEIASTEQEMVGDQRFQGFSRYDTDNDGGISREEIEAQEAYNPAAVQADIDYIRQELAESGVTLDVGAATDPGEQLEAALAQLAQQRQAEGPQVG